MDAIDELKAEHRGIESALRILARIAKTITRPESTDVQKDAHNLIEFFKIFADACHHGKEEGYLFPVLEQMGVSRAGGPIGMMLNEHELGRKLIKEMDTALSRSREGKENATAAFQNAATEYIDLLHRHIFKEDNVLFEIAIQRLSKVRLQTLAEDFERLEQEKIGVGRHETFHRLLEGLEKKYDSNRASDVAGRSLKFDAAGRDRA